MAKDVAPLGHRLVRRQQYAAAFVAPRDELEEDMGACERSKRQGAELVDDERLRLRVEGRLIGESILLMRLRALRSSSPMTSMGSQNSSSVPLAPF